LGPFFVFPCFFFAAVPKRRGALLVLLACYRKKHGAENVGSTLSSPRFPNEAGGFSAR
jgi:hypothetical protein